MGTISLRTRNLWYIQYIFGSLYHGPSLCRLAIWYEKGTYEIHMEQRRRSSEIDGFLGNHEICSLDRRCFALFKSIESSSSLIVYMLVLILVERWERIGVGKSN